MSEVKELLWAIRGEGETVTCARCGKEVSFEEAIPEEAGEWECPTCWKRCEMQELLERERESAK